MNYIKGNREKNTKKMAWLLFFLKYILLYQIVILYNLPLTNNEREGNRFLYPSMKLTKQRQCIFPSVYKRKAIYECQHIDISIPNEPLHNFHNQSYLKWWCPLTDNYDHYPEWQLCPETTTTYGGNQPGQKCHFPFLYHKRLYTTCIRYNGKLIFAHQNDIIPIDNGHNGYWWCSTTANFDEDGLWTKCRPQLSNQLPCYFKKSINHDPPPHHYHYNIGSDIYNIDYECQPFSGHWLCYTELNQLRECPHTPTKTINHIQTEGGNDPGFPCYFPFQATLSLYNNNNEIPSKGIELVTKQQNFTSCLPGIINPLNSLNHFTIYPKWITYWCSTTENFDRDQLWTRCNLDLNRIINQQSSNRLTYTTNNHHNKYIQSFKLSEIWSQLNWLTLLTNDEKMNISHSNNNGNHDQFQQSLNDLEYLRATWEFFTKTTHYNHYDTTTNNNDNNDEYYIELTWWLWLAPFWWLTYKMNHLYTNNNSSNNLYTTYNTTNNVYKQGLIPLRNINNNNNNNLLITGFNLPIWLSEWSESGWYHYNINMNQKWYYLLNHLYYKWFKTWLFAFFLGFLSNIILLIFMILMILIFCKKSIRLQLWNQLLKRKKIIDNHTNNHQLKINKSILFKPMDSYEYILRHNPFYIQTTFMNTTDNHHISSINSNNNNNDILDFVQPIRSHCQLNHDRDHDQDHHNDHEDENVEPNFFDKSIKNKIESYHYCYYCYNDYNIWNINNTTNMYTTSSINKDHIKCLIDELNIQHSSNNENEDYFKQLHNLYNILNIYLHRNIKYLNDNHITDNSNITDEICYTANNNKDLYRCCTSSCCHSGGGGDDDGHLRRLCSHGQHPHPVPHHPPPPHPHHHHCCCSSSCPSCLFHYYSLNHRFNQHCYHDKTIHNYHSINDKYNRNEIKEGNEQFMIEPTAPPPSYDQIIPIL
ncbi:unnamed protein product [Schistosoma rodhaini]|nr:unnamed protein product [Schistosoma rodhaini]